MARKRLIWQIFPAFLFITAISLLAMSWYASRSIKQFYIDRVTEDLQARST